MIEVNKIKKQVNNNSIIVVDNLILPDTGFILIDGESGTGKSTLLNLIGSLETPNSGDILYNGKSLYDKSFNVDNYRKDIAGIVFQDNNLLENMTVYDNISLYQNTKKEKNDILEKLNILKYKNKKVMKLSGGEKKLVAIARALLKKPSILICDEPFTSLDINNQNLVLNILKELSKDILVLVSSHNMEEVFSYADRIIMLKNGVVIEDKTFNNNSNASTKETTNKINNKNILKITFNQLLENKFTLILSTILLSICLFLMLIACSLKFDFVDILLDTLKHENIDTITYTIEDEDNVLYRTYSKEDIHCISCYNGISYDTQTSSYYDLGYAPITTFVNYNNDSKIKLVYGNVPVNDNEIIISTYTFDIYSHFGLIKSDGTTYKPSSYEEITSTEILFGSSPIRIVGIYETNEKDFYDLKDDYDYAFSSYKYSKKTFRRFLFHPNIIHYSTRNLTSYLESYGFKTNEYTGKEITLTNYDDIKKYLENYPMTRVNFWKLITLNEYINLGGTPYAEATGFALTLPYLIITIIKYISILIILLAIFISFYFIRSCHIKNKKNIALLKSLGCNKKDINHLVLYSVIIYMTFSFVIALFGTLIFCTFMNTFMTELVTFYLHPFHLSFIYVLMTIIVISLIIFITWMLLRLSLRKNNELVYLKNN